MPNNAKQKFEIILLCGLISIVFLLLFLGSVPPVSRDALTHHLFVPKLYLNQGLVELSWLQFSYYPMNLDLLYLLPLVWGNDIVPKYIHCGFGLLTALLIFLYLRKWLGNIYGYIGAIFFLTIPVIVKLAITVYVDLGLVFFSTTALFFLLKWIESDLKLRHVCYAAIFCGLALGTKYNGLLVLCILGLLLPVLALRSKKNRSRTSDAAESQKRTGTIIIHWILFGAIAVLVFSPWMVRNYVWKGNPLYPLYQGVFNHPGHLTPDANNKIAAQKKAPAKPSGKKSSHFVIRRQIFNESGWDILLIPMRIFIQGEDDNPKYFDGRLTPLLLLLPMCAFIGFRSERRELVLGKMAWLVFAGLYLIIAFLSVDMRIRYIAPIIPPLAILSVFGFRNIICFQSVHLKESSCRYLKYIVIVIVIGIWLSQWGYVGQQYLKYRPDSYLSGKISRDAYIESYRPEYAALTFANQTLDEDALILGVYLGGRGYYSDRDIRFEDRYFEDIIRQSQSAGDIVTRLRKRGFTHILISEKHFDRWSAPRLTVEQSNLVQVLFGQQVQLIFHKDAFALYQLSE